MAKSRLNLVPGRCGWSLVWIMLLNVSTMPIASSTTDTGCHVDSVSCPGRRPRDANGCCPLKTGEACPGMNGQSCDTALGISCMKGTCRGLYNLSVTDKGDTFAVLSWSFDPNDNSGSDITILYSTHLHDDTSQWNSHSAFGSRNTTLGYLTPDTWYYARIAILQNNSIVNVGDTVLFKTAAKQFCLFNGRRVAVGELIVIDCQESCVCERSGHFICVPVCTPDDVNNDAMNVCSNASSTDCCRHLQYCLYENCTYLGEDIPHEFTWTIDCMENCTCYDGEVTCTPLCQEVPSSSTCENPVISRTPDGCCDVYDCNSTDTCVYDGRTYGSGTWFTDNSCKACQCHDSTEVTSCLKFDTCLETAFPAKSPVCLGPILADNQCCQQVVCEPQMDPRYIFKTLTVTKHSVTSIIVRFQFITSKDEHDVKHATLFYTRQNQDPDISTWSNVTLTFDDVISLSNLSLDITSNSLYKVQNKYIFLLNNLSNETFYYIRLQLEFNSSPVSPYFTTPAWVVRLPGHHNGSHHNQLQLAWLQVLQVTATTALLTWVVPETIAKGITSYNFRYKTLGDSDWHMTEHLIYTDRKYNLMCLYEQRWYQVELISFPGHRRLAVQFLYTPKQQELSYERFSVTPTLCSITHTGANVKWAPLTSSQLSDVISVSVHWNDRNVTETQLKVCLPPTADEYWIDHLDTRTVYKVWLGVTLRSGGVVYSKDVYFVTSSSPVPLPSSHHVILTSVVTGVCIVAIATTIAIVVYLVRCRRRAPYQSHTGFENKIYQIHSNSSDGLVF